MRVEKNGSDTWYYGEGDHAGCSACVSRNKSGHAVHAMWRTPHGNWIGGYGEGRPITLEEATDLASRFVTGLRVPEELGGFDDNGPPAQRRLEVVDG